MTLLHLSVRGNDHTGFDRVLSLQMALRYDLIDKDHMIPAMRNSFPAPWVYLLSHTLKFYWHIMSGPLSEIA